MFFFSFFLSRDVERGGMRVPTFDRTRAQLEERENGERKRVPWAERQQGPGNEFSTGVPGYRVDEALDKRLFTTGFFFPLFILFILAGLANAPVSISSGPAEMRCVKRNETQKHSQLILWKCIRRIAHWRIGSITLSTTRSSFSVWKRQRRFYLFLAWFLCSGSAIQEMSLPWSFVESSHKKLRGSAVFNPGL